MKLFLKALILTIFPFVVAALITSDNRAPVKEGVQYVSIQTSRCRNEINSSAHTGIMRVSNEQKTKKPAKDILALVLLNLARS